MAVVRFRGMPDDRSVGAAIDRWIHRLEVSGVSIHDDDVEVSRLGNLYEVHLAFTADGYRLLIAPDRARAHAHHDPYVAVSDAFRAAWRRLRGRAPTADVSIRRVA
jgi:hypothetical protein